MVMKAAVGGSQITTPSLAGANATNSIQPAQASFNLFVGDQTGINYFSKGDVNTGGPGNITVSVGDTITWSIGQGSHALHTVTSLPGTPESFNSGFLFSGGLFSHTFLKPGSYPYYCSIHAGYNLVNGVAVPFGTQVGTINVVPEPGVLGILVIGGFAGLVRRRR